MTKASFSIGRKWHSVITSLFVVAMGASPLSDSNAKETYHCPAGKIYQVSKRLCVPKAANLTLLKSSKANAAHVAPVSHQRPAKDDAPPHDPMPAARTEAPPLDTAGLSPPLPQGLSAAPAPAVPQPSETSPYGSLPYNAFSR